MEPINTLISKALWKYHCTRCVASDHPSLPGIFLQRHLCSLPFIRATYTLELHGTPSVRACSFLPHLSASSPRPFQEPPPLLLLSNASPFRALNRGAGTVNNGVTGHLANGQHDAKRVSCCVHTTFQRLCKKFQHHWLLNNTSNYPNTLRVKTLLLMESLASASMAADWPGWWLLRVELALWQFLKIDNNEVYRINWPFLWWNISLYWAMLFDRILPRVELFSKSESGPGAVASRL